MIAAMQDRMIRPMGAEFGTVTHERPVAVTSNHFGHRLEDFSTVTRNGTELRAVRNKTLADQLAGNAEAETNAKAPVTIGTRTWL